MIATASTALSTDVLAHLDDQIESARRLLGSILAQGAAIRERDVKGVLARMTDMQREMELRGGLEECRRALLARAGDALGLPAAGVTLDALTSLMAPADADAARARSGELRGLLAEIAREHGLNRVLLRQELTFLDHVVRLMTGEPQGAYRPGQPVSSAMSVPVQALNLQA
jgi:hypothetical protein